MPEKGPFGWLTSLLHSEGTPEERVERVTAELTQRVADGKIGLRGVNSFAVIEDQNDAITQHELAAIGAVAMNIVYDSTVNGHVDPSMYVAGSADPNDTEYLNQVKEVESYNEAWGSYNSHYRRG